MSVFNTINNFVLDIFFPRTCVGCDADGEFLCQNCQQSISINPQILKIDGIAKTIVTTDYHQNTIQKTIKQFKYHNLPQLAEPLTTVLTKALELELSLPHFTVLAVPLHQKRFRQRGYNQSDLLARKLANYFHWPVLMGLSRVVNTKHQAGLNRQQRLHNLSNAFRYSGSNLKGKNILVVDDVVTTGSTFQEIAQSLQAAQPKSIWAIAVARNREDDN